MGAKGFSNVLKLLEERAPADKLTGDEAVAAIGKLLCGDGPGASRPFEILQEMLDETALKLQAKIA